MEAYTSRIVGYMNGAATCFAMSVAKETGLLSVFTNPHQPMTIPEIASKANLKQRYVQEILGCLVTARVVEIDDNSEKYYVPQELQSPLKDMMVSVELMDYLQDRKEDLKSCLDPNGPKGFSGQSRKGYGAILSNLKNIDLDSMLNDVFFNSTPDLKVKLESGIDFIEYGCGQGTVILELAARFPLSRFVAVDYSSNAIAVLQQSIEDKQLKNLKAQQADIYNLTSDWNEKYDIAYVHDVLHDLGCPEKGARDIARTVKNGGIVNIIEYIIQGNNHKENIQDSMGPQTFALSAVVCVPESLGQEGGAGMGCTTGMKGVTEMITKAGYPESKLEIIQLINTPYLYRFIYRK